MILLPSGLLVSRYELCVCVLPLMAPRCCLCWPDRRPCMKMRAAPIWLNDCDSQCFLELCVLAEFFFFRVQQNKTWFTNYTQPSMFQFITLLSLLIACCVVLDMILVIQYEKNKTKGCAVMGIIFFLLYHNSLATIPKNDALLIHLQSI